MSPKTRFIFSIVALIGVFVIGTFGFLFVESDKNPTLLDAAFMTAITLSTVGYGQVWELSEPGKVWSIAIITFGIATVSIAFTSLITLFVSGELRSHREKGQMQKRIELMRGHIILCGYGRMGRLIAASLMQTKNDFAVVEVNPDLEPDLRELGVAFIIGDSTEDRTLERAGIEWAGSLIAILPHDADNVFITLTAKSLNPSVNVVARAEQLRTEGKLLRAGASRVICPQMIGATRIVDVLLRPNVVDFVDVAAAGVHLEMDEYRVPARSGISGRSLGECRLREKVDAMIVAIKRGDGETIFNPGADTTIDGGDTLVLVGKIGVSDRIDQLDR